MVKFFIHNIFAEGKILWDTKFGDIFSLCIVFHIAKFLLSKPAQSWGPLIYIYFFCVLDNPLVKAQATNHG